MKEFVVTAPQPLAWLIVTGQVDCLPNMTDKPPREACGQRVRIVATKLCRGSLLALERFRFDYPAPKKTEHPDTGLWRRDPEAERGYFRGEGHGRRAWVPNLKFLTGSCVYVKFPLGNLGTASLDGWLHMDGKQALAQYRPEGTPQSDIKLHQIAAGPYCWVLRRPQTGFTNGK